MLELLFKDVYQEPSFKKCVDIMTLERKFGEHGVTFPQNIDGKIGKILRCFGEIQYDLRTLTRMPEKDPKELQRELMAKNA